MCQGPFPSSPELTTADGAFSTRAVLVLNGVRSASDVGCACTTTTVDATIPGDPAASLTAPADEPADLCLPCDAVRALPSSSASVPSSISSSSGLSASSSAAAVAPPSKPARRRRVTFSELPLSACVRTFDPQEPPLTVNARHRQRTMTSMVRHRRPFAEVCAVARVRNVLLETASYDDPRLSGTVVVRNIAFEKKVTVRYSVDGWKTTTDHPATWRASMPEYGLDRFHFEIDLQDRFKEGSVLQLCLSYQSGGQTYWDNNGMVNYQAVMRTEPKPFTDTCGLDGDGDGENAFSHSATLAPGVTACSSQDEGCVSPPGSHLRLPVAVGGWSRPTVVQGSSRWCQQIVEALQNNSAPPSNIPTESPCAATRLLWGHSLSLPTTADIPDVRCGAPSSPELSGHRTSGTIADAWTAAAAAAATVMSASSASPFWASSSDPHITPDACMPAASSYFPLTC